VPSFAEWTDDALVAAAAAGDEAAFEQLFERHRRPVARIAGRFFPQREQIEEIIQDSFTKAYFALNTYHGTHEASFRAWLTQIAINTCYDQLRRARLSPEDRLVLTLLDVEGFSVAEIAEFMNWTISKVKVRAHRARAHLRRVVQRFL